MTSGTNAVLCKIPEPLPVIHWGWGDLKSCDIALQGNQGMSLEAKIGFFFGRAPAIICTICTEGATVPGPLKLTDWEGEAVNHKITAGWYGEWLGQPLTDQLCHLQKGSSGPVEPCAAADLGKEMAEIPFYKGIPGVFRVYPRQFAADTQSDALGIRHLCCVHISPLWNRCRDKLLIQTINNC